MTSQIPDPNENVEPNAQPGAEQPHVPQRPPVPPVPPVSPQQPQQAPQYAQPQQPQQPPQYSQQQPYAQQQPAGAPGSTIQLNYWLSVFFAWIPSLIFYLTEKGRSPLNDQYNRENLNFSLVRTAVGVATWIVGLIPFIGWLIAILGWLAGIVLFVFHIIAAAKAKENFDRGQAPGFVFNFPFVK